MDTFCGSLAKEGVGTVRFEFAYMEANRDTGKNSPPPRAERLMPEYEAAIAAQAEAPLFIGGKSMGGRIASMVAEENYRAGRICGLVCLGYPFHPPGKPDELRTSHLFGLTCPALILQGDRDPYGDRREVEKYGLPECITFAWLPDGDHDLVPRKRSGRAFDENLQEAVAMIASFMRTHG